MTENAHVHSTNPGPQQSGGTETWLAEAVLALLREWDAVDEHGSLPGEGSLAEAAEEPRAVEAAATTKTPTTPEATVAECVRLPNDGDETCMTLGAGRDDACDDCLPAYPSAERAACRALGVRVEQAALVRQIVEARLVPLTCAPQDDRAAQARSLREAAEDLPLFLDNVGQQDVRAWLRARADALAASAEAATASGHR